MGQNSDAQELAEELESVVGKGNILTDEPMSEHTTFKIGGPADLFVLPGNADEVKKTLEVLKTAGMPYFILGKGSDLLVDDAGYRGAIVSLERFDRTRVEGTKLVAGAGATLKDVCAAAQAAGLSGLEFACGIPGSVGGAAFMNAGAYDGVTADVLESLVAIDADGNMRTYQNAELDFGYRRSRVRTEGLIVLEVTYALKQGDKAEIQAKMDDLTRRREEKQPLEYGSAGSTFKRPEGFFAGKLITDAGLKGYRVGDAAVSMKHAGFVVNLGHATAKDVHAVIGHVQDEVLKQFGVFLEPEVRFL